jgi:hypothetical protein
VTVRIHHPLTNGRTYDTVSLPTGAQQVQDQQPLTVLLPEQEFGWGYYSLNVQVTVEDPQTSQQYVSDWWPRLTVHQ